MDPGIRTLLMTDIVDSTRLTEQLEPAARAALWSGHDRAARDLIPAWRGREVDKTDGLLVLFESVRDAVGYALAYHRAVAGLPVPMSARAGIHVGPVTLRPNPATDVARGAKPFEIDGMALPVASRVMSIAAGGQTLLSADAREALGASEHRVESHGHWLLHGVERPVEIFEVGDGTDAFATPADGAKAFRVMRQGELWQPVREVRHSLPAERDGFVGQRAALRALAGRLEAGSRLVSILGIGGAGKTRLASRFGWMQLASHPGGVWFCDLSQARTLDGLHYAVAQGLEVPLGQADPGVQLGQAIAGRGSCLVILDNFEQVSSFAEETLGRWLERAPLARFVVTSREVLGIVGEDTFAIPPLATQDAVSLFVKRSGAAASLGGGPDDQATIERLVGVLDHLPLAIELAAARARVLSPRALLARMHDRFAVLLSRAGRRDRQATLLATFDWSWELLSDRERAAFARLSVFEGGFTLASAAVVLEGQPNALPVDYVVQSLVDKSLVRRATDDRFDLLQSVSEYAARQLRSEGRFEGSGQAGATDARARHWRHFATLDDRTAAAERCVEIANLVIACRRATAAGDVRSAVGCLGAAWACLRLAGPYRAGVELAESVAAMPGLEDGDRCRIDAVAGSALDMLGDAEASGRHVRQGLLEAERAGDDVSMARLLIVLGSRQTSDGDLDSAMASLGEAHRLSVRVEDGALQIATLNELGRLMDHQARFDDARRLYSEALALARSLGDQRAEGGLLGNLGVLNHTLGDLASARSLYEQSLRIAADTGDRRWDGNGRCNLGMLHQAQGRDAEARQEFAAALATAREIGHVRLAYTVQCNLGILLTANGALEEAIAVLRQSIDGAVASSDRRSEGQFRSYLGLALARHGALAEARSQLEQGERLLIAAADRLSLGVLLCNRAETEARADDPGSARAALRAAEGIADELNCGADSELRRCLAAAGATLAGSRSISC